MNIISYVFQILSYASLVFLFLGPFILLITSILYAKGVFSYDLFLREADAMLVQDTKSFRTQMGKNNIIIAIPWSAIHIVIILYPSMIDARLMYPVFIILIVALVLSRKKIIEKHMSY